MSALVTVAIPVRDGAAVLEQTLSAVRRQRIAGELELIVCDSGSHDGSLQIARRHGAELLEIAPQRFSHGGTRNLLMERSRGGHVAFLTQDAVPADELWLDHLLRGFSLADDVGIVFGPYRPRPGASVMVARELTSWFESFSARGEPRIDRLDAVERLAEPRELLGVRGFFTDANGCVARSAWERVPFREVAYAEDHVLAHDMLRAGYAKVYVPDAAVLHSHEYSGWDWLRRSFDEARALHEVYGWAEPLHTRTTALKIWGCMGADWRWARAQDGPRQRRVRDAVVLAASARHHTLRATGALLGARADRLPASVVRRLSLEGRGL